MRGLRAGDAPRMADERRRENNVMALYELALFAGAGGGILSGILDGRRCVGAVEIESYPRRVLMARQRDGMLPWFPIWDDIRTFRHDNPSCTEYFDWLRSIRKQLVISGGFPCQDISAAGSGAGLDGARSGLWHQMARVVGSIRPYCVFVENSPMLTIRGLGRVLGDFTEMGYNAKWCVLSAADAIWLGGTPIFDHLRERIFIKATNSNGMRQLQSQGREQDERRRTSHSSQAAADTNSIPTRGLSLRTEEEYPMPEFSGSQASDSTGQRQQKPGEFGQSERSEKIGNRKTGWLIDRDWWASEPFVDRMAYGVANGLERGKAIGNGQVPAVASLAWEILS